MRKSAGPGERIRLDVGSWPGVVAAPHRFGGLEFRYGRRELGHVHGDSFADLPFPRRVRDQLVSQGRARPHHVLPDSGWVTAPLQTEGDLGRVIELFRLGYERAVAQGRRRAGREERAPERTPQAAPESEQPQAEGASGPA